MKILFTLLAVMAGFFVSALAMAGEAMPEGMGFLTHLVAAWGELGAAAKIVGVLWVLAPALAVFVSLTPTPKDNRIWGAFIYPAIEALSLHFFRAKDKPGEGESRKAWK